MAVPTGGGLASVSLPVPAEFFKQEGALAGEALARSEQAPFPGKNVVDDSVEIVELRPPVEGGMYAPGIDNQRSQIAGAAAGYLNGKIAAAHALDRSHRVKHRRPVTIAAIGGRTGAAAAQIAKRSRMRAH